MAARTHSSASSESLGSLRLSIITFSDIDNGDTYDSYIPSPVAYWANGTDDPTQNLERVNVTFTNKLTGSEDIGRFTFRTAEDNRAVMLYVLSR
jgi:hypothetical protein